MSPGKGFGDLKKRGGGSSSSRRFGNRISRVQQKKERQAAQQLQQGDLEGAEISYRELLEEGIISYTIFEKLSCICYMQNKMKEMIPLLRQAIAIKPDYPEDYSNLGIALYDQGDVEAAIDAYRQALSIKPDYPEAYYNLGIALRDQGDLQAAIAAYRQALAIKPNYPEAHCNLGLALHDQDDLQAATDAYRQALSIKPDYAEAWYNFSNVFHAQGDLKAAIEASRQALSIKPDFSAAHFNRSLLLLLSGDYENGWKEYEWRLQTKDANRLSVYPRIEPWTGSNLSPGERLILVSEQGLGDTLQFMRYVLHLSNTGRLASLCAPTKLHALIRASGITTMIHSPEETSQLTTGKWLPLLSLPGYLQVHPDQPIIDTPYIQVPAQQVEQWHQKLVHEQRPVIGINWQGNPGVEKTSLKGRSLPLEAFATIMETTTVTFLSLQKGFGSEQLADCPFRHRFVRCQEEINRTWDFVETAAIIANCDLVITSDTVVAHLAAGMGQPTWLLLTTVPEWRWGMEGDTSFWYPSMRLFRQRERGNWQEAMDRVATALAAFANRPAVDKPKKTSHQGLTALPKSAAGPLPPGGPNNMNRLQQKKARQAERQLQQGNLEGAEIIYRALLEEGVISHPILSNLAGVCLMREGKSREAATLLRKAIAINPNDPKDHSNLGTALVQQGDLQGAVDSFSTALTIQPNDAQTQSNLAAALFERGDTEAAIDAYGQALAINPDCSEVYYNLAIALRERGDLEAAIDAYGQALAINPDYSEVYYNLAIDLRERGDLKAAIDASRQALAINPDYPDARRNLSLLLLLSGDYENGWKEYEWRLRAKGVKLLNANPQVERWTGSNLSPDGRLILVSEQGLGDTLMFMRYVLHLSNTGRLVSLCAPTKLHGLIRASGITTMIHSPEETSQLTTGKWLPLLSLPGYLQVHPDQPIIDTPYIQVPAQQVEQWHQKLVHEQRPVIGINWQGNPGVEKTSLKGRSLPLEAFATIMETTTVTFLSLQKGFGSEQLADCPFRHRFVRCQEEINRTWDFVETAAIIANCDLVITSDTVVAHLAAGMGQPTWLLLTTVPEWRWGMEGDTSFWYPSMRLFRQRERGNWQEAMDRVATALAAFVGNRRQTPSLAKTVGSTPVIGHVVE